MRHVGPPVLDRGALVGRVVAALRQAGAEVRVEPAAAMSESEPGLREGWRLDRVRRRTRPTMVSWPGTLTWRVKPRCGPVQHNPVLLSARHRILTVRVQVPRARSCS